MEAGVVGKSAVDALCVLARKMVDGVRTVKARLTAKGFRDADLNDCVADAS